MAENYYKAGETYYAKGSRENKKNAAKMFSKIVKYYPEYRNAKSKYESYKEEAMQRVMFSPIKSYVTEGVNVSSLIYTNLNSYVVNSTELTEFTQILSREQVDSLLKEQKLALEGIVDPATVAQVGKTLGANIVIDVEIPVVSYSESEPSRSSTEKSWDEKYGEESYKDPDTGATKIRDLKRKKYYTEISYSKSNKAIITVAYSIKDIATSQVLKSDKFTTESEDYAYWKIYKGDTPNKLTSQTEPDLASEAELITKCSDAVSKKLASSIIGYLKKKIGCSFRAALIFFTKFYIFIPISAIFLFLTVIYRSFITIFSFRCLHIPIFRLFPLFLFYCFLLPATLESFFLHLSLSLFAGIF